MGDSPYLPPSLTLIDEAAKVNNSLRYSIPGMQNGKLDYAQHLNRIINYYKKRKKRHFYVSEVHRSTSRFPTEILSKSTT